MQYNNNLRTTYIMLSSSFRKFPLKATWEAVISGLRRNCRWQRGPTPKFTLSDVVYIAHTPSSLGQFRG